MNAFKPVINFIGDLFKELFNVAGYFLNGVVQITWGFVKLIGQALAGFGKLFYQYMFTPWIEWQKWQLNFFGNIVKMFWNFGVNLISAFVNGIRSKINEAVGAVADMTGQIAEYLPHSPAKKGGLSMLDVNGQRFVETFIKGIESAGLTNFLNNAFIQPMTNASGLIPVAAGGGTSPGNQPPINITYNITARDSEDILKQLKTRDKQLLELINRSNNRINRESY
ncbi:MAG: hypothetical protein HC907_17780 [Richelia sp. SM1_7_0]|nr:hypothetical protein [Richelia sp. SM1_7_0]